MEYEVFLSCLLLTPVPLLVLLPQTTLSHVFTASSLSSHMESWPGNMGLIFVLGCLRRSPMTGPFPAAKERQMTLSLRAHLPRPDGAADTQQFPRLLVVRLPIRHTQCMESLPA